MMKKYLLRVLIALDQLVNTIFGGYPNETLSARAWRRGSLEGSVGWNISYQLIDFVFLFYGTDHCELSYIYCKTNLKTCGLYFPTYQRDLPATKHPHQNIYNAMSHEGKVITKTLSHDYTDLIDW